MAKLCSGANSESDPGVTSKGVNKEGKGKDKGKKGAKTNEANNISTVSNSIGDIDVSSTPLQPLQSLSGFGSLAENLAPLSGHAAQAVRLYEQISPPKSFSGDKKDWPFFKQMFENYVKEKIPSLKVDLMSPEGYDDETEEKIYIWFLKLMNRETYDIINPDYRNKGTKTFQDLDEQLRGTTEQRRYDCTGRLLDIRYQWGEKPAKYVAEITRLVQESYALGVPPSLEFILGNQIRNLPNELERLQAKLQDKYVNGYPKRIGEYTRDFTHEINRLIMNGVSFDKTQVNMAATEGSNPPNSNNQVKKKRKKKLQVSKASTVPVPEETYEPPQKYQNGFLGRGRGGRGGRGNSQRGRGAPRRSDFQNYNDWNTYQQKPTCLKCGSSREGHTSNNCYSHVWCNNCRTDNHGPRACRWL